MTLPIAIHPIRNSATARSENPFATLIEDAPLSGDVFVARGAARMNTRAQASLYRQLPAIREKIDDLRADAPRLALQARLLALFFSAAWDTRGGVCTPEFRRCQEEVAFALAYMAAGDDLVPDYLPEIGYVDDAAVIASVLERNAAVLRAVARALELPWDDVEPRADATEPWRHEQFARLVAS
jgi:uncharacterized membrane protein YkvA (DUF1232 family)